MGTRKKSWMAWSRFSRWVTNCSSMRERRFLKQLDSENKLVFLDLKMDDVMETIRQSVKSMANTNAIRFITIQGGAATARAAKEGRGESEYPKLLSLTLLSSLDEQDLRDLLVIKEGSRFTKLEDYVEWRARDALDSGVEGLIASNKVSRLARVRDAGALQAYVIAPYGEIAGVAEWQTHGT